MIRQKDIALIILITSIALVASWFVAGALINKPDSRSQEVEVIRPITADFTQPSIDVFNDKAINPTELIRISDGNKDKPFIDSSKR